MKIRVMRFLVVLLAVTLISGCNSDLNNPDSSNASSNLVEVSSQISVLESGLVSDTVSSVIESAVSQSKDASTVVSKNSSVSRISSSESKSSSSQDPDKLDGYFENTFYPLGKNTMPIGAWVAPPPANFGGLGNPNYITDENYRKIKESGLNFIQAIYERGDLNINDVMMALEFANNHGLKYLVRDNRVNAGIDDPELMNEALDQYKNEPAFMGNMMFDEPATKAMTDLGLCKANYIKSLPNSIFYINLLPTYASKNQLFINNTDGGGGKASESDYRKYVQTYIDIIKPRFISYDYYPCEGTFPNLSGDYFLNMSIIREAASNRKVPFWVFIQNCSFGSYVRNPVKSEIEWQVNTALAYGAKGIQYFTYWSPIESDAFSSGMVTKTGEITPTYNYIKNMNKHITSIDQVLMNSTSTGIILSGSSPVEVPDKDIISSYRELIKVSSTSPAMVGCFNNVGSSVYYAVNNSIVQSSVLDLTFAKTVKVSIIQNAVSRTITASKISLNLTAGEGALVKIEN